MVMLNLDLTGIKSGANFLQEGTYLAAVTKVEQKPGRVAPGLELTFASLEAGSMGGVSQFFLSLSENALWKVKQTIERLSGTELPEDKVRIDIDKLIGMRATIKVVKDPKTVNGEVKEYHKISDVFPALAAGTETPKPVMAAAPGPNDAYHGAPIPF